jgi:hypothetical protein
VSANATEKHRLIDWTKRHNAHSFRSFAIIITPEKEFYERKWRLLGLFLFFPLYTPFMAYYSIEVLKNVSEGKRQYTKRLL